MDLLKKFEAVTIENDTRISEADKSFCEAEQEIYTAAATIYLNLYLALQEQWPVEE